MEVEVEGAGVDELLVAQPLDPGPQQPRDRLAAQARRVLRHEGGLGDGVEARGERDALVEDQIHDVAAAGLAEQLEQQGRRGPRGRPGSSWCPGTRSASTRASRSSRASRGRSRNSPPTWVEKAPRASENCADVGDGIGQRARAVRGRSSSARRGRRAKPSSRSTSWIAVTLSRSVAGALELVADVVDGEVALAQGDNARADGVLARLGLRPVRDVAEEVPVHLVPEAPAEDAEGAGLVAEPAGGLGRRQSPRRSRRAAPRTGAGAGGPVRGRTGSRRKLMWCSFG